MATKDLLMPPRPSTLLVDFTAHNENHLPYKSQSKTIEAMYSGMTLRMKPARGGRRGEGGEARALDFDTYFETVAGRAGRRGRP